MVALTKAAPFGYSGLSWILLTYKNMQETQRRESVLVRKEFLTQISQGPEYTNTLGWGLPPASLLSPVCTASSLEPLGHALADKDPTKSVQWLAVPSKLSVSMVI